MLHSLHISTIRLDLFLTFDPRLTYASAASVRCGLEPIHHWISFNISYTIHRHATASNAIS